MKRRTFLATVGVTGVAVAGCLNNGLSEADYDIGMSANAFIPERFEITVGDTVVWGNNGSRRHTVTAFDKSLPEGAEYFATGDFNSNAEARDAWFDRGGGAIVPGEVFEHTFSVPGNYGYYCIPHEYGGMFGLVVVE